MTELQPFVSKLRLFHLLIVDGMNECLYILVGANMGYHKLNGVSIPGSIGRVFNRDGTRGVYDSSYKDVK